MKTRSVESGDSLFFYRHPGRSAISRIFLAPVFSALLAAGPQWARPQRWTLEYVVYVSLLMVLDSSPTLQDRFGHARQATVEMFPGRPRPGRTYQGYVKARRQITRRQLRLLKRELCRSHRRVAGGFWRRNDWLAFSADGTRIELPRTTKNEKAFGCAGRDKTAPQLSLTSLYHLGTGLPWAWRIGPGTESEQVHLRRMIGQLPRGALLIADAGFTSFDLLRSLAQRHVEVLVRMGSNRTLLTGLEDAYAQVRGERVWLWPKKKQTQYPPLKLRLLRIEQANHSPMCLATSVLDEHVLTDQQIGQFYRMRWGQEVFHRSFKQTLGQHKMHSTSPGEALARIGLGADGVPAPGSVDGAGPDRGAAGPVDLECRGSPACCPPGDASGGRVPSSRRSDRSVAPGGQRRLRAPGPEGRPPLAPQEERPPPGPAEDARGNSAGKTPCHKDLRKNQRCLSSRRWMPPDGRFLHGSIFGTLRLP
jgi:hypothetical protein